MDSASSSTTSVMSSAFPGNLQHQPLNRVSSLHTTFHETPSFFRISLLDSLGFTSHGTARVLATGLPSSNAIVTRYSVPRLVLRCDKHSDFVQEVPERQLSLKKLMVENRMVIAVASDHTAQQRISLPKKHSVRT